MTGAKTKWMVGAQMRKWGEPSVGSGIDVPREASDGERVWVKVAKKGREKWSSLRL